jgi:hypothetical protein
VTDAVLEVDGLTFVVEAHKQHLLPGLTIEVQRVLGREGLVAWNTSFAPGGC